MPQRPRTILPTDPQDERLAALPLTAAYTYAYLPTVLDDLGRAKDQPAVLNGYLWPLRADDHPTTAMASDLDALADAGLICRYAVDGTSYLHDPQWRQRQKISRASSEIPPCPHHDHVFEDVVTDALNKVTEQVKTFLGESPGLDERKVRDTVGRFVEDVSFLVDPEKAASIGARVREFLGERPSAGDQATEFKVDVERVEDETPPRDEERPDDPWQDATDDPGSRN
ncbi:MAG TPA: hypothetical protein VFZ37_02480 [Jiangellaceae bacterium]